MKRIRLTHNAKISISSFIQNTKIEYTILGAFIPICSFSARTMSSPIKCQGKDQCPHAVRINVLTVIKRFIENRLL